MHVVDVLVLELVECRKSLVFGEVQYVVLQVWILSHYFQELIHGDGEQGTPIN